MKKYKLLGLLVGFLSLWGCTLDVMELPSEDETTLQVYAESENATRQGFDQQGNFYWSATDQLGVTTTNSRQYLSALKLVSGAGSNKATFKGQTQGSPDGYAICPFSDNHEFEGSTLKYYLPDSYNYGKVDKDFFTPTQGQGNSFNAPMWGSISSKSVTMRHLGGVLCIKFEELPLGNNLKLVVSSRQKMNGYFSANLTETDPVIKTEETTKKEEKEVSFNFSNQQAQQSGVFYVPVPVGTYKNTRIRFYDEQNKELSNTSVGDVIVARTKLKMINIQNSDISGGDTGGNEVTAREAAADLLFGSQQDAQELTLNMKSNWHVEVDGQPATKAAGAGLLEDWLEISPMKGPSGSVTISTKTTANTTKKDRKGRVKIVSDDDDIDLDVIQVSDEAMVVAKPKYTFGPTGGSLELDVDDLEDNFTIETSVGWIKNKSLPDDDDRRLFEITENTSASPRYGKVIFTSGKGMPQQIIEFEQAGNDGQVNPNINNGILIVSSQSQTFDSNRHAFDIEVLSQVPFQVETPSLPWIHHIETIGQRIHFELDANATYDARNALIRIYNVQNNQMAMLSVNQMQKDAIVLANPMYQFSQYASTLNFEVGHNVDYDMKIDVDWITRVDKPASSRALTHDALSFQIAENKTNDNREGHITFTSKDKAITQTVLVKQAQVDAMIIDQKAFSFDDKAHEFTVNVNSNVEFEVVNNISWVHQIVNRSMTSHALQFTVDENHDYSERSDKFIIRSTDMKQRVEITVTQAQKAAIVLPRALYTVDYKGGPLTMEVQHNVDINVTTDVDWIQYQPVTKALADKFITVNIKKNNDTTSREGHVILTSTSGVKEKITIRQLPESMQHEVNVRTRLTDFYKAVVGDNWWDHTNWCTDKPLNEWYGVTFENNLLTLNLTKNNVIGDLDLSNFPELSVLILDDNNITSLDVSFCAMLKTLQCNRSAIETLNPVNCPMLESISCSNNRLKTIPFTGLEELKTLVADYNQITALDLLPVTKLTELDLSYNNKLEFLPVNYLKQLKILNLRSCNLLKELDCSDMISLENLDITSSISLYHLKLDGCSALNIISYDFAQSLRALNISHCRSLQTIIANDYNSLKYIIVWDGFNETEHPNFCKMADTKYLKLGQTTGEILQISNPAFKQSLRRECDYNMDDEISVKEAALVKIMSYEAQSINGEIDLSAFVNLEELNISNNPVTNLNLQSCRKLRTLDCYHNYNLTNLDLSSCSSLTNLKCYNNNLTSLDLSSCSSLTNLECYSNNLTSLDLSSCSSLTNLECYSNNLTSLDLSSCSSLTNLDCQSNNLTSLDISLNPNLGYLLAGQSYDFPLQKLYVWKGFDSAKFSTFDIDGAEIIEK